MWAAGYWKLGRRRVGDPIVEQPMPPESSDLRLPKGLLHLLQEFQLVLCLLQVAVQDLAPDDPWARDRTSMNSRL